jgi:hypothetical protein
MEPEQTALVLKEMRENGPWYTPMVGRLGRQFVSTLPTTASKNINTTLSELEVLDHDDANDEAFVATVKDLSTVARQSSEMVMNSQNAIKEGGRQ